MRKANSILPLIDDIVNFFRENFWGVLLEGSAAWLGIENARDVDLDIIGESLDFRGLENSNSINNNQFLNLINRFTTKYLDSILALDIKMVDLKFFYNGKEISLRLTKASLFRKICSLDLEKVKNTKSVLVYRQVPTKPVNIQRNFSGEEVRYNRAHFENNTSQIIETPILIIDQRNKFYPGEIIDRYLSFPKILSEKGGLCSTNLNKLKKNLLARLKLEKRLSIHDSEPNLRSCLSRSQKIPENLLKMLDNNV